jgi:peptide deformylase
MAAKEILKFGDSRLKRVSRKVEKIDGEILQIIEDMKESLYSTTGIGLAAPQIGILKRIILIDLREEGQEPIILLNPAIVAKLGREESTEGCLSYPGYEGKVIRPRKVTVHGLSVKGEKLEYFAEGLLAKAFCHEIDHLDGILYTDRAKKVYKLEQ